MSSVEAVPPCFLPADLGLQVEERPGVHKCRLNCILIRRKQRHQTWNCRRCAMTQAGFEGTGPEQLFRERLAAGELTIQRCEACGAATAQPVVLCPTCGVAAL